MMRSALLPSLAVLALALAACDRKPEQAPPPADVPEAKANPSDAAMATAGAAVDAVTTPTPGEQGGAEQWRKVANAEDQDRIAGLGKAWSTALKEANVEYGAMVDTHGMLLVPKAALAGNLQPGPGTYRCRTIKVGSMDGKGLAYVEYPWFKCSIDLTPGGDLILTKTTGSQRTRGLLYPDTENRLIFVGAQAWGMDEKGFPSYGQMPERDQVGVFERIGTDRWRLAIPYPKQESKLDVLELKK